MDFLKIIHREFHDLNGPAYAYTWALSMLAGYLLYRLKLRICQPQIKVVPVEKTKSKSTDYKMVMVIRMDLKMGKGKVAAQCAHAALAGYKQCLEKNPKLVRKWELNGQAKITVKVDDEKSLKEVEKHAKAIGLCANTIQDAGLTQISRGSRTVCAVGPGSADVIDQVTGHLKLY